MKNILVLMSTYNGGKYLREQIDSILDQIGCNVSLLIRDDGSTDQTQAILNDYAKNQKLIWYTGENLKTAKSFLHLLINCQKMYDYYSFSDQDDVWDKDKLYTAISKLECNDGPALYCSNALLVNSTLNCLNQYVYKHKPEFTFQRVLIAGEIQGATIVFNKQLAICVDKIEMPEYVPMHDYFVAVLCGLMDGIYIYDENSHMSYRQHETNVLGITTTLIGKIKRNYNRVFLRNSFLDLQKMSKQLLADNYEFIEPINRTILEMTATYKDTLYGRIRVAFMNNLKFGRLNQEISYRMALLFGKI